MSDVIVVGGGPAGSVTAMLLARAGYHVLLLDRARFPRPKACGDCISPGANRILKRIGVWDAVLQAEHAQLRSWRLVSGHASFAAPFSAVPCAPKEDVALAIERTHLDALLLQQAERAGVQVLQGAKVHDLIRDHNNAVTGVEATHEGRKHALRARLTIGADGLRSIIARKLRAHARRPRLRKASFTLHAVLPYNRDFGEMRLCAGGCVGIAPVAASPEGMRYNITVVLARGSYDARAGAREIVARTLSAFPDLAACPVNEPVLASGPFDWPVRQTVFDGAALVGDAAGYYDPFTGQGIYQALAGAELLASHAAEALCENVVSARSLHGYARAQRRLSSAPRKAQHLIEMVCARPKLADRVFNKLARADAVAATLIGVTGDLLPARAFFSPRLLAQLVT